jgi:hypothetical protein
MTQLRGNMEQTTKHIRAGAQTNLGMNNFLDPNRLNSTLNETVGSSKNEQSMMTERHTKSTNSSLGRKKNQLQSKSKLA